MNSQNPIVRRASLFTMHGLPDPRLEATHETPASLRKLLPKSKKRLSATAAVYVAAKSTVRRIAAATLTRLS